MTYAYTLADQLGEFEGVLLSSRGEFGVAADLAGEVVHRFTMLYYFISFRMHRGPINLHVRARWTAVLCAGSSGNIQCVIGGSRGSG